MLASEDVEQTGRLDSSGFNNAEHCLLLTYRRAAKKSMHTITTLPLSNDGEQFLLPSLQQIFPLLVSYSVIETIVQGNAVGYILALVYPTQDEDSTTGGSGCSHPQPARIFVKHVDGTHYARTKTSWNDLRRTLLYARTEERFYRDFAPRLNLLPNIVPHHWAAEYHLSDWIPEDERATAPSDLSLSIDELPETDRPHGGILVLECIDTTPDKRGAYVQNSPISVGQARQCLSAVAALHVAGWEKVDLLTEAQDQLSQASFHLNTRNPSEVAGLADAWERFAHEFRQPLQEAAARWSINQTSIQQLGRRLQAVAQYVSDQLSPEPTDRYATLVHGDYKAMNVFLPRLDGYTSTVVAATKIVDYASTGIGLGMSDVAMHVHHAVLPEDLDWGGEEKLVQYYWITLIEGFDQYNDTHNYNDDDAAKCYPWTVAWRHYRLAVVDYARFFVARFWKSATIHSMSQLAQSKNTCLLNRSVPAAMAFVRRVDKYLTEIESEMAQGSSSDDSDNYISLASYHFLIYDS